MAIPRRRLFQAFLSLAGLLSASANSSWAKDHFLAIGGGDSPSNNQISLEKNVLFFQRLLSDAEGPGASNDVLFSDGNAGSRDVQFMPAEEPPRLNVLLARLFGRDEEIYFNFRAHQLPNLRGPSTRAGLEKWFDSASKTLGDGDRLFIYFTGHGGPGKPALNTTMSMWCERPMHVNEFVGLLDRLSPKVRVVLVMVQCHSGGFAGTIFKDAKGASGLSAARRCGFFATTSDRNAAGCTPDTVEDDYKDYSTYFFAALDGKTRTGKPVTGCDLNGDGHISLAEAHAYVLLNSDTIDVPVTTSEALLRQFSKTSGEGLLKPSTPYRELLEGASTEQKAVIEGLASQLKLTADDRYNEARRLGEMVEAERKTTEREQNRKTDEANNLAQRIRGRLVQHWPELTNPWHPRVAELMKSEGAKIQHDIEMDSDCPRWELLQRDSEQLFEKALDLERKWVKCQRLMRTLDTAALAANLEKVAAPEVVQRYKEMIEDESGTLTQ